MNAASLALLLIVHRAKWLMRKTLRVGNPDHLFVGTAAENTADMVAKGRARGPHSRARAA